MHSVSQTLVHRGPGVSRARARWQPYVSIPPAPTARDSPVSYLITPASSVSSSPPVSLHAPSTCSSNLAKRASLVPGSCIVRESSIRDAQKTKYTAALVDQAVHSLCDIWQPKDVPSAFRSAARTLLATQTQMPSPVVPSLQTTDGQRSFHRQTSNQLPSPVTPSTQRSPAQTPAASPDASLLRGGIRMEASLLGNSADPSTRGPMKHFVFELLRRSKTPAIVLQTALCYLEAIRSKIPDLADQERLGLATLDESAIEARITKGEDEPMYLPSPTCSVDQDGEFMDTVRTRDEIAVDCPSQLWCDDSELQHAHQPLAKPQSSAPPATLLPPLPSLPTPLLCPRRTFLAAIILASKFLQDKCYSNRAWAKLSGLPPREVGRCERALGAALEWRLWVGKLPPIPPANTRQVVRSRSLGDVLAARAPVAGTSNWAASASRAAGQTPSSLRRHSTVPVYGWNAPEPTAVDIGFAVGSAADVAVHGLSATYGNIGGCSPPVLTPMLTYSPTSTDSTDSVGDPTRTIQMTTFTDLEATSPSAWRSLPAGPMWGSIVAAVQANKTGDARPGPTTTDISIALDGLISCGTEALLGSDSTRFGLAAGARVMYPDWTQ